MSSASDLTCEFDFISQFFLLQVWGCRKGNGDVSEEKLIIFEKEGHPSSDT
jgi:hypothetical protein